MLVAVLRVWACGLLGLRAAVGLLAGHRFWLGRSGFLTVVVQVDRESVIGELLAWVGFEAAAVALRAGWLPCSGSQSQVLAIAASLAVDEPVVLGQVVSGLDEANAVAVAAAVLHAGGHRPRPVLVGDPRQVPGR